MTETTSLAKPTGPAAANDVVLEVEDLYVTFPSEAGDVAAVRGIDYQVRAGEVLGIVGESGSGKSVSSLAVMGLLPRQARVSGSVRYRGQELLTLDDRAASRIRGKEIAMVFQDPLSALTPVYTVGDQVAEALLIHHDMSRKKAAERAVELLDLVGIPNARQRALAFPHEFSGGMRQRVTIAIAIANDPDVIIADEPTTALDVTIQAQILSVLETAQEATGAAIVIITHDLGVVAGFADRVQVMYAGRVVESGSVDDVFYRPRMPYTLGLLGSIPRLDAVERQPLTPVEGNPPSLVNLPPGCKFVPRCPLAIDICSEQEPPLVRMGRSGVAHTSACHRSDEVERAGATSTDIFPAPLAPVAPVERLPREQRDTVLSVDGLVRHFALMKGSVFRRRTGTVQAVDGVSFDIREGETLALVGESGCGKTTTLMEILNLARPQQGSIAVLGRDTARLDRGDRFTLRRDLQVVFQDPMASLDPRMPIGDILAEPLRTHGVPPAERQRRIRDLLKTVGLSPDHANRYPNEFSGGQRQRVGIARALALQPKLVVLDEPVSALDVSIRAGVINLLEHLKVEFGLSYLFVAHDLSVVRHIADRVSVMYLGRIVESGPVDRVFEASSHPYTQALLSAIPLPDPRRERERERILLRGDLPSPADPPSGCRFRTRCQKFVVLDDARRQKCIDEDPPSLPIGDSDHTAACHYAEAARVL
ncbi:ABC transporter ATP-binding protein [Virgisporangium ochraceum]|uniref:Oligopeptide ABC transporter ATP-binding protein OppF n=1 Tax=Virgisporangium ochraceum TaxID=65505 RepID=A0A8J4EGB1_9ACTN|nr:ABC transporter ATP-binding protein [Virgisporangium ochraceum]GIJ73719.1 oligopeptide ABC transporter ATP-binding protein OppF [Virgisporangium ochraceum]